MGRKKRTRFQMIREDVDETPREVGERPDRGAERQEAKELSELANRLAAMVPGERARLSLPEHVQDEIDVLARAGKDRARKRQVRRVAGVLRDHFEAEAEARERLDDELAGNTLLDQRLHMLERWRDRILAEGDPAIQAFVEAHEGADRPRIRTLARQATGEDEAATRAHKALFQVLRAARPLPEEAETPEESP